MSVNLSTESIARASSRRPWITIGIWVVLFLIAGLSTDTDSADS